MDGAEQQGQDSRPRRIRKAGNSGRRSRYGRYIQQLPADDAAARSIRSRRKQNGRKVPIPCSLLGKYQVGVVVCNHHNAEEADAVRHTSIHPSHKHQEKERHTSTHRPGGRDGNKWAMQSLINDTHSVFPVRHRHPHPASRSFCVPIYPWAVFHMQIRGTFVTEC